MRELNRERLPLSTKIGFGVGDIFGGGAMMIIGFYYLYFLTDVVLLSPSLAGTAFLVSKVWDAVTDPVMGIISDRTRTRFGRRRPYFLAGIVLIFLSFFAMWYPVDFTKEMHRFVYILVAYVFFSTVITMVMIPYNALVPELTPDYNERTSLTTFRIFFSGFSSLLCAVVPFEIVKAFKPDVNTGFIVMAAAFGLFFALPFIATFLTTRERPEFQKEAIPLNLTRSFIDPFRTPTFLPVLLMYVCTFVAMDMVMSVVIYFMSYYMGKGDQTNYVLGVLLVTQLLVLPLYYFLSKRTGKKTAFIAGIVFWICSMGFSFLVGPGSPTFLTYVFGALVGVGTGGVVIMIYSIFPDIPDVDELCWGSRREGIYSGMFMFMRKLSSALGIFIISNIIEWAGYRAPVEGVPQEQTGAFILVLRVVFAALPVALLLLALVSASFYRLTPELHGRIKELLEKRRGTARPTAEMAAEERELRRALTGR
jgi:sugar (glycoside-pentoside-hexuronide) transporter